MAVRLPKLGHPTFQLFREFEVSLWNQWRISDGAGARKQTSKHSKALVQEEQKLISLAQEPVRTKPELATIEDLCLRLATC